MGLLDDAIREHIELKRRHGASSEEVARLEREALGPARREPGGPVPGAEVGIEEPPSPGGEMSPAEHLDVAVARDSTPTAEEQEPAPAREPTGPLEVAPVRESGMTAEDAPPPPAELEVDEPPRRFAGAHALGASPPEPREGAVPEGAPATDEWDVPDAIDEEREPADEEADDEDVLEETPDFLQETPEHDRLWFEQKPPRDFDFDR
jgi:hypothetical protein